MIFISSQKENLSLYSPKISSYNRLDQCVSFLKTLFYVINLAKIQGKMPPSIH